MIVLTIHFLVDIMKNRIKHKQLYYIAALGVFSGDVLIYVFFRDTNKIILFQFLPDGIWYLSGIGDMNGL